MTMSSETVPGRSPVTHFAYVVDDLERAAHHWGRSFGAGPFFLFENVEFELLESPEVENPRFEHSTALGQWGPIAIELQQMDRIEPEALYKRLVPDPPGIAHSSYISPDLEADKDRLATLGFEHFLHAETGPFDLEFFSVPGAGHSIEIYRDNDFVRNFFPALKAAADGWDGSEPLRVGPPL